MAKVKVFADRKMLITKKEEHKNLYKTKNVGIDIIYKSYFIIFFVERTCQKLWPRLKFLLTDGRTDGRTDRVITIGLHIFNVGALINP